MNSFLSRFQDGFAQALLGRDHGDAPGIGTLITQPGFFVFRNTVMKGCIDTLQANFPSVARLVGEEWFRSAAAIYVQTHLPDDTRLLRYGEHFAQFLENFEPAAELSYLSGVARLDRLWMDAHAAPDATPLAPETLAGFSTQELGNLRLRLHPASRWMWFPGQPIYSIWSRNRAMQDNASEIEWRGEGALLVRPQNGVEWHALDRAGHAFLDACHAGLTIGEAACAALDAQQEADLAQLLSMLLSAGAFSDVIVPSEDESGLGG